MRESVSMLRITWEKAGEQWTDEQHQLLGDRYISPLQSVLKTAESALETMDEVILRVKRDCG